MRLAVCLLYAKIHKNKAENLLHLMLYFSKLSAEDYSGLMETLYLVSVPGMREKVMDGLKQPLDECLDEEDVEW